MPAEGAALVTGGARRIGAHLVRTLAEHGYAVAIHHRASVVEAEDLAAEIERAGGKAAPVQADLGDPAQAEGLLAAAHAAVGPVTVLVNNAAIFERDRATDFTLEQWDRQLAINLRAPWCSPASSPATCPPARADWSSICWTSASRRRAAATSATP